MAVVETGNPYQDASMNVRAVLRADTDVTAQIASASIDCVLRTEFKRHTLPRIDIGPAGVEEERDGVNTIQTATVPVIVWVVKVDTTSSPEFDQVTDLVGLIRTALLADQQVSVADEGQVANGWGDEFVGLSGDLFEAQEDENSFVIGAELEVVIERTVNTLQPGQYSG